ncbi:MAG TPA: YihY/virulence factor BrkB family protein [Candidatus Paceibacterota bacterium]|jgi:membrane protein|nr:YihY/virulence factor BrkB family protein [Candidatus Paceibacterota bacterium]
MTRIATLVKETFLHWYDKNALRMGAAISFYAIFSTAPFFILLIGIVRTIFDKQTTTLAISRTLNLTVGSNLSGVIQTLINSAYRNTTGWLTTIIGGIILIITAISVFAELNTDLDELWTPDGHIEEDETAIETIKYYFRERLIVLGLILVCGFLLMFSVAVTVFISLFYQALPDFLQNHATLLQVFNIFLSLVGSTFLFSLIYRVLPEIKLPWKEIIWGAFVTAILFLFGRFLISWYIGAYGKTSTYGAAGSVVGLLLWIYYSAQVFFIGASGTFVYSTLYGSLSKRKKASN